ncbi:MAG: hypothetical protein ACK4UK_05820, partial [Flavobacterium sp.]
MKKSILNDYHILENKKKSKITNFSKIRVDFVDCKFSFVTNVKNNRIQDITLLDYINSLFIEERVKNEYKN